MRTRELLKANEAGSAFVISILVLFVLSVLGLALMLTTTTESDISVNYRWGEMAFFNADAALEYGKNVLAAEIVQNGDFGGVLPAARPAGAMTSKPGPPPAGADCADPSVAGCRDHQYFIDQNNQRIYIGRILRDLNGRIVQYDFRAPTGSDTRGDIDRANGPDIQGTVTLWVRRPIDGDHDYAANDRVILTAEGTAPSYEGQGTGRPISLRRLEMSLRMPTAVGGSAYQDYSDTSRASDATAELGSQGAQAGNVAATVQ